MILAIDSFEIFEIDPHDDEEMIEASRREQKYIDDRFIAELELYTIDWGDIMTNTSNKINERENNED